MDQFEPPDVQAPPIVRFGKTTQVAIVGVVALLAVVGFLALDQAPQPPGPAVPRAPSSPFFKPTAQQWAGLKLQRIGTAAFQDSVETDGTIAIDDDLVTPVFSPYSGRVTRLFARAGDHVAAGDDLFAVRATELAQAQNDLISGLATLKTARAQLALATTNEKRQHALYLAQGAALRDWQQSQLDLATAQGGLTTASIALAAVRSRLRILGKSDSDIAAIEATPDLLSLDADAIVHAPIAGTITQRQIGLGQNIVSASAGATTPVFQIGDLRRVWLIANAREDDAPMLHKGDPVDVHVLAFPGRVFHARLTVIGATIDPNTHRLPVKAEVENPSGELKPDMLASFRIVMGPAAEAPSVPLSALVYDGPDAHVWIADPATRMLAIRPVRIGREQDGHAEILQGLKAGDTVVVAGGVFIDRAATTD